MELGSIDNREKIDIEMSLSDFHSPLINLEGLTKCTYKVRVENN